MFYYRIVIAYKGSQYYGWQDLGSNETKATVQSVLMESLLKIAEQGECSISASSRTDAGVHAQGQVAKVTIPIEIDPQKLKAGWNSLLPKDIRILQCIDCGPDFNPNKDSSSKTYRYYFSTTEVLNPIYEELVAHVRYSENPASTGELNFELMDKACTLFLGSHDFVNFATKDQNMGSTVRELNAISIHRDVPLFMNEEGCFIEITGKGFLRHMVRYIVATLFDVGRGDISLEQIEQALKVEGDRKLSPKAKSKGLHLMSVNFD